MKILLIIVGVILVLFIAFQIYITMSIFKTETQPYKVIREEKQFEIRYYPAATMAMITSNLKSYSDLGSSGFGKLAKYIFGGNSEKKQIAMTAPVHMDIGDSVSTMSFVMPAKYKLDDLPKPNSGEVVLKTSEAEYVAVIQFGGFSSAAKIEKHRAMLEKALQAKGLAYHGNFRFLGYNPPFQLFGRKNEVIVALDASEFEKE
jgi:hypothetical protein